MNVETASYSDLKNFIKGERAKSQDAKDFFGDYTHSTTEELREMVEEWQFENDYQEEDYNQEEYNEVETSDSEESVDVSSIAEVVDLLEKAANILKSKAGYVSKKELQDLHTKAMEIEYELGNQ